jgi:hypothetical protein
MYQPYPQKLLFPNKKCNLSQNLSLSRGHPLSIILNVGGGVLVEVLDGWLFPRPAAVLEDLLDKQASYIHSLHIELGDMVMQLEVGVEVHISPEKSSSMAAPNLRCRPTHHSRRRVRSQNACIGGDTVPFS